MSDSNAPVLAKAPGASLVDLNPDAWTEPFWLAARERRLVCQKCTACGTFRMPPEPFCHECLSQEHEWVTLSGKGKVYTFTIVRRALIPDLADAIPHVPAIIELPDAGGQRLVSNVIDVEPEKIYIGMPVTIVWDEVEPGSVIPRFRPE